MNSPLDRLLDGAREDINSGVAQASGICRTLDRLVRIVELQREALNQFADRYETLDENGERVDCDDVTRLEDRCSRIAEGSEG